MSIRAGTEGVILTDENLNNKSRDDLITIVEQLRLEQKQLNSQISLHTGIITLNSGKDLSEIIHGKIVEKLGVESSHEAAQLLRNAYSSFMESARRKGPEFVEVHEVLTKKEESLFIQFRKEGNNIRLSDVSYSHNQIKALAPFVGPEISNNIMSLDELVGQKPIASMFLDISGFSTFNKQVGDAKEVFDFLNRYLSTVCPSIFAYEGTIDKFEGDAIVSHFNMKRELDDTPCTHALQAGQDILEIWKDEVSKYEVRSEPVSKWLKGLRIGINYGDANVGAMGFRNKEIAFYDFTAIGENVDLASRLEQRGQLGKICVSSSFKDKLVQEGTNVSLEDYPLKNVKGHGDILAFLVRDEAKKISRPLQISEDIDADRTEVRYAPTISKQMEETRGSGGFGQVWKGYFSKELFDELYRFNPNKGIDIQAKQEDLDIVELKLKMYENQKRKEQ